MSELKSCSSGNDQEKTCMNIAAMKDMAFTCSECNTYYSLNRKNSTSVVRYCPYCGARVVNE